MNTRIEFVSMSEDPGLREKSIHFVEAIKDCEIAYIAKGEYKKYANGKASILPSRNSVLYVRCNDKDYNKVIIDMITIYEKLSDYFRHIEHHTFINLSFYSDDMFSLEFDEDVLALLSKHHLSLPISCYRELSDA